VSVAQNSWMDDCEMMMNWMGWKEAVMV